MREKKLSHEKVQLFHENKNKWKKQNKTKQKRKSLTK